MKIILEAIRQDLNNEMICTNLRCKKSGERKPEDAGFVYGLAVAKDIIEEWLNVVDKKK
jgi:hypothetical protein